MQFKIDTAELIKRQNARPDPSHTNLGQLESVTTSFGGVTKTYSYSYYPNGLKKTYTNPENITYTYYYNKNNQLIAVYIPNNGQITYSDFNWLMPQTLLLPGGQKITYSYTDFLQVKERILKNSNNQSLANALYEYDAENNITKIAANDGGYTFSYDNLYRLKTTDVPVTNPANDETFDYDGVGNRTNHATQAGQVSTAETLTYNNKNQLIQSSDSNNGTTEFTYTNSGHTKIQTKNNIVTEYIYNHEERLIGVKNNNILIAEYAYNPQGQRVKKIVNGTTIYYLYNENGLAAEYTSTGQLIKEYQFHPQKTWMTDPLFMRTSTGDVFYYHNDHLGTPQQLVDSAGNIVWQATYGAFGKAHITIDTVENNLRFPGQYYDSETGLWYNWNRYYDASIGRYISSDPIGLNGGLNTYAYVGGNPLSNTDPTGLIFIDPWGRIPDDTSGPEPRGQASEDKCGCFAKHFLGYDEAALAATEAVTGPYVLKPRVGISGGGRAGMRTSVISSIAHEMYKKSGKSAASTFVRGAGRFGSRFVPYAGTGMLLNDLLGYEKCMQECQDDKCQKP